VRLGFTADQLVSLFLRIAVLRAAERLFFGSTQNEVRGVKKYFDHERHHVESHQVASRPTVGGRGSRRAGRSSGLTGIRHSRSFALPKGSRPVARQSLPRTGFRVAFFALCGSLCLEIEGDRNSGILMGLYCDFRYLVMVSCSYVV